MARWTGVLAGAACLMSPSVLLAANAADQLYERTLMSAADARCRLFEHAVGSALDAARAQARGATLRSGASQADVEALEQRARGKAAQATCRSKDMTTAADRVRSAFEAYATLQRMHYPGDLSAWHAERGVSATIPLWRLSQPSMFGADRLIFGLVSRSNAVSAVATFADGAQPYAARLVMRDPARTQGPYLNLRGGAGLSFKVAPRSASQVFNAETREQAPVTLLPTGAKTGLGFRFPVAAAEAISLLDPREAVTIEFTFADRNGRDAVRKAYVEVGDFAAGRAFLR
jgi:hypothetical protein